VEPVVLEVAHPEKGPSSYGYQTWGRQHLRLVMVQSVVAVVVAAVVVAAVVVVVVVAAAVLLAERRMEAIVW